MAFKICLNHEHRNKLKRLPQEFVTNVKINDNKILLDHKLIEIYKKLKSLRLGSSNIENIFKQEKKQLALELINMTYKEVIKAYVESVQYMKDKAKISSREGEKISILYTFISENFYDYYFQSRGNRCKRNMNIKQEKVSSEN
jgi:hypothetical protein